MNPVYRLSRGVQVRKESWGLLFYSQSKHKACFVRSGNMLSPQYFDGTWEFDCLVRDIAEHMATSKDSIVPSIEKAIRHLSEIDMISNELC